VDEFLAVQNLKLREALLALPVAPEVTGTTEDNATAVSDRSAPR
jgi:hypothetical protein